MARHTRPPDLAAAGFAKRQLAAAIKQAGMTYLLGAALRSAA